MAEGTTRATRVEQRDVAVGVCPICGYTINGTVEVAIYMGAMKVKLDQLVKGGAVTAKVDPDVSVEMRSMTVQHRCEPARVKRHQEALAKDKPAMPTYPEEGKG